MSIITRRQIAGLLQTIASSHFQINTFGWGDVPELLGRQNTIYPFMMVTPESPVMGEGEVTHPFRISIADRLQKGLENIEEVDSDMYQVLRDVITQIDNVAYQDMRVELPLTIDPFRAEDAQDVYGFSGVVNIIVDENYDQCAIPSDDVPFDPNPPTQICLPALIENSDSSYVVNVASGGSLILPDVDILVVDINDNPLDTSTIPSVKNHIIDVVCNPGTVSNSDSSYSDTVLSGGTLTLPDITVTDSDGSTFSQPSVTNVTCTLSPDADVENSDSSYSVQVAAGATLTLPDQDIEVNGVLEGDIPSVGTIEIEVNDEDGNPLAPDNVTITGRKVEIDVNTLGYDKNSLVFEVATFILGESNPNQFIINVDILGTNNYNVKTSDGQLITGNTGNLTITFPAPGTYIVEIIGTIEPRYFGAATADRNKLIAVLNWGNSSLLRYYADASNIRIKAKDVPSSISTILTEAFRGGGGFYNDSINNWNVSSVTDIRAIFRNNSNFNQPLNNWNVSSVTLMGGVNLGAFAGATSFNQPLNNWNTNIVTNMVSMFFQASRFNQDISTWNVSSVTSFAEMFRSATAFNQNLGAWQLRTAGTILTGIFRDSGMNTANYTDTIVGWANYVFSNSGTPANVDMATQTGRTFTNSRSGGANFVDAQAARAYLVSVGWTISGDTVV